MRRQRLREINRRRHDKGDEAAQLAYDVFVQRIRRFVGAYLVTLGRVDVIAFTAGIGQNAPDLRADVLANLEPLGIGRRQAQQLPQAGPPADLGRRLEDRGPGHSRQRGVGNRASRMEVRPTDTRRK